jgi:hypothetical protein
MSSTSDTILSTPSLSPVFILKLQTLTGDFSFGKPNDGFPIVCTVDDIHFTSELFLKTRHFNILSTSIFACVVALA